jgi:hypothetical protein
VALPPPDPHAAPPLADDDGVRVLRKAAPRFGIEARLSAGIALVVAITIGAALWRPADETPRVVVARTEPLIDAPDPARETTAQDTAVLVARRLDPALAARPFPSPNASGDPDDLASYFRPGDPVPSTANLIKALNEAGVRTGIAAFNPPGTSPPLEGLAVPADFELPPGYVRHHQATDEGETIEPILMFSPDLVLRDAQGRPIPLPANRVVPPELAPPGLPRRWVRPGKP